MTRFASGALRRIEHKLDQWGRFIIDWWVWPVITLVCGVSAVSAALLVYPGEGEQLMLFGAAFGQECGFKIQYGYGCFSCGMTRSWVYSARGQLEQAFHYNAAGSLLFLWLSLGMVLGAIRLFLRRPSFLRTPPMVLLGVGCGWVLLMFGIFIGRAFGVNALP